MAIQLDVLPGHVASPVVRYFSCYKVIIEGGLIHSCNTFSSFKGSVLIVAIKRSSVANFLASQMPAAPSQIQTRIKRT